jgi:CRISPR-associated protein Cmr4
MATELMAMEKRLLSILAETSVHAGTGTQLGAVDLPIQRERHTEWPTIYGTGLKGVFRDEAARSGNWSKELIKAIFGPETEKSAGKEAERHSGALAISDARLLMFPVRTIGSAFAWLTCPLALARLRRDALGIGITDPRLNFSARIPDEAALVCTSYSEKQILLEEFEYRVEPSEPLTKLANWIADTLLPNHPVYDYWRNIAQRCLVVVADDDFRDFVRHGTEIVTRVRLTESKTVEQGALWTEENLPSDTLLYCFAASWQPAKNVAPGVASAQDVIAKFSELLEKLPVIQVGGKETVGRGIVAVRLVGGNHA